MRKLQFFLLIVSTLFYITNPVHIYAQSKSLDYDQERLVIKFRPFIPNYFKNRLANSHGVSLDEQLRLKDTFVIRVPKSSSEYLADRFSKSVLTDYVEIDAQAEAFFIPDDPLFNDQWGLVKIKAVDAWDVNRGSGQVDIAIVDSGVNTNHPDFAGRVIKSVDCRSVECPDFLSSDPYGHGTHVAGIAASVSNNGTGISGLTQSNIFSIKVLSDTGTGYYSWIANGIVWAVDNGAEVINLSLGGKIKSFTLENAVNYAWQNGVLVVAAAGNYGSNTATFPAHYSNVIAVAATGELDQKASFSNFGSWVDVAAPGVEVISTEGSSYSYKSGTSMAAPYVSGLAALIFSENPEWSNSQVRSKIELSSQTIEGTGNYFQFGRIDACSALDCDPSESPTPTFTPTPTNAPTTSPSLTPTPSPTVTPTSTQPQPTQTSSPTPTDIMTPTLAPTPTQIEKPWWCVHVPWHYTCQ